MLFALSLEGRDLLEGMKSDKAWVVSDELAVSISIISFFKSYFLNFVFAQDNIRTYTTAFLLSPTLSSYRGKVSNKLLVRAGARCLMYHS